LAIGMVAGNVLGVLMTYILHPHRPKLSLAAAKEMISFSKWLVLNNGISFLQSRSPDFVIGRLANSTALGLFSIALEISTLPTTELVAPINRVALPGYSKLASNRVALRDSYLDVLSAIGFFALPAGLGLSAVAPQMVDLFLGAKWTAAVPLVQVLGVFGAISALVANTGPIYNALGKPYMITLLGGIHISVLLSFSISLALTLGPVGVAFAYVSTAALVSPVIFWFIGRELDVRLSMYVNALGRSALSSVAMFVIVVYLSAILASRSINTVLSLTLLVVCGAALYAGFSSGLWLVSGKPRSSEFRLVSQLVNRITRLRIPRMADR